MKTIHHVRFDRIRRLPAAKHGAARIRFYLGDTVACEAGFPSKEIRDERARWIRRDILAPGGTGQIEVETT